MTFFSQNYLIRMTHPFPRPYAGVNDLRRMQAVVANAFDQTWLRVGDLAWLARHHTHRELSLDIRLWEDDRGEVIGWTFFQPRGAFNLFIEPDSNIDGLVDDMLDIVEDAAHSSVLAGDPLQTLHTYGIDPARSTWERTAAEALERRGFAPDSSTGGIMMRRLDQLPEPMVPRGYRLGAVESVDEVIGRVEAQRAAFAPSDLTLEKYERVRRTWPYRPNLDRIVITDDGSVAAFCTAWIDEQNASALLEPVGTQPDHQRRGLGRAVCLDALRALTIAGARTAEVAFVSEAASAMYASMGFSKSGIDLFFRKPLASDQMHKSPRKRSN